MKTKLWPWIIVILLSIIVLLICFYYFMAFNELNNLINTANNGTKTHFEGNTMISSEDFYLLQSIVPLDDEEKYYVNGGTFLYVKTIGINKISFKCLSNYPMIATKDDTIVQDVEREFVVTMVFQDFRWKVDSVKNHEI